MNYTIWMSNAGEVTTVERRWREHVFHRPQGNKLKSLFELESSSLLDLYIKKLKPGGCVSFLVGIAIRRCICEEP